MPAKKLKLDRESLARKAVPPNNCTVKAFLETLDDESREILEEALAKPVRELPAPAILEWLEECGAKPETLPSQEAIKSHRNKSQRGSCRCPK